MSIESRRELISKIEELRGSKVICFLTSLRPNIGGNIADDQVRVFFDHLLKLPSRPVEKLDIYIVSNGGSGTVPWRLVSLLREFSKSFNVLVPYRAYSAATLLALGADEIVMHPFGELGPIDPTVSNDFNPSEAGGRRLGISVEDVKAYVNFIKNTVGITHEDELIQAISILARKVHPLALGNVERFVSQSRMIATKILRTHMRDSSDHVIEEIVENMASKLYFHGHPINRKEAQEDLHLKVKADLAPELEKAMWELYLDFERDFQNLEAFHPPGDLAAMPAPKPPAVNPMGMPMPMPMGMPVPPPRVKEYEIVHAAVESTALASQFKTKRRYELLEVGPGQKMINEDVLAQGWSHSLAT